MLHFLDESDCGDNTCEIASRKMSEGICQLPYLYNSIHAKVKQQENIFHQRFNLLRRMKPQLETTVLNFMNFMTHEFVPALSFILDHNITPWTISEPEVISV